MNFDNNLHEDLFDLFILNWFVPNKIACIEDELKCKWELEEFRKADEEFYSSLRDLFPQELHPEQYERWISKYELASLENNESIAAYDNESVYHTMGEAKIKITITVEQA